MKLIQQNIKMQNNQDNTKRIAKNTMYMFIRMALVMCVGFFTSRIVLNTLGVEDFGIYNIVGSVVIFLSFFRNALDNATYRYLTYDLGKGNLEQLKKTFAMTINAHILLAISLFIILECIGIWFLNNKLNIPTTRLYAANWVFQFSLFTFLIEILRTPFNSSIISHEHMNFYAYTSIVEVGLKLAIVYILLLGNLDKLILYSLLTLVVSLIMLIWYITYCLKHYKETHYQYYWNSATLKNFMSYSGWSLLVNASDITVQQCINIFFNIFGGVTANAAMGIANQVNSQLNKFLHSFTTSFNPQIIKSYAQNNFDYFMKLLLSTSKLSYFLLFSIAFPVMLNINFILKIWLIIPPALTPTLLYFIVIYSLIDALSAPLWNAVHATGKLKIHQILMSSIKIMNIPIAYLLLKNNFPLYTVIITYAFLNGLCCIVRALYMRYLIHLSLSDYFIKVIGRCLFVSLLSIILPLYYTSQSIEGWEQLLISTFLFLIPYLIFVYYIGLNKTEKLIISNLTHKNKRIYDN